MGNIGNRIPYDPKITRENIVGCIYTDIYEDNICVITDEGYPYSIYLSYIILTGKKRGEKRFYKKKYLKNGRLPTLEDVKTYKIYELVHSQNELNNLFSSHFVCPKML